LKKAIEESRSFSDSELIIKEMRKVVPTYHLPEEVNCKAQESDEMKMVATV
jgi:hypothetical protein